MILVITNAVNLGRWSNKFVNHCSFNCNCIYWQYLVDMATVKENQGKNITKSSYQLIS